jgi:hypothetical protein
VSGKAVGREGGGGWDGGPEGEIGAMVVVVACSFQVSFPSRPGRQMI